MTDRIGKQNRPTRTTAPTRKMNKSAPRRVKHVTTRGDIYSSSPLSPPSTEFFGHRLQSSMTRATVKGSTALRTEREGVNKGNYGLNIDSVCPETFTSGDRRREGGEGGGKGWDSLPGTLDRPQQHHQKNRTLALVAATLCVGGQDPAVLHFAE